MEDLKDKFYEGLAGYTNGKPEESPDPEDMDRPEGSSQEYDGDGQSTAQENIVRGEE